jgi:hypothetical protein
MRFDLKIGPVLFTAFCFGGCIAVFAYFIRASVREHRVVAGLWVAISYLTLFWLESPFSYISYATYNPALPRFPHGLGVINQIYGNLPLAAVPGYVAYFMIGGLAAKAVAERFMARGANPVKTLIACGFLIGFVFDFIFEQGLTSLNAFHYVRIAPWTSLFPGSFHQFPIYISLSMAIQHTVTTYLLGAVDRRGDFPVERWARARTRSNRTRNATTLVASVFLVHVMYLGIMAPHMVAKAQKWNTTTVREQIYDEYPNQQP